MLVTGRDLAVYYLKCYSHHKNKWDISNLSAITVYNCDIQYITVIWDWYKSVTGSLTVKTVL